MVNQLGDLLRRHRLTAGGSILDGRTKLRREDVAARAGISTGYYAQLEQGRRRNPSRRVLEALAAALGLSDGERRELLALAPRPARPHSRPHDALPALARALAALEHLPASVLDAGLRVVSANSRWRGLHTGFTTDESLADMMFLDTAAPDFYPDWHHASCAVLSLLAAATEGEGGTDTRAAASEIRRLRTESAAFERRWTADPAPAVQRQVRLRVRHPVLGRLSYRHDLLFSDQKGRTSLHVLFPMNSQTTALTALLDLYAPPSAPR
ncbi:helix-turn-helix domain-containing protein [Nocardioides sp.]|uniref:MmyB family transcriptional regulator n=1 Tax=Nocardioides sp. TaxID=35761 RepID=UPI0019A324B1|nr:helix-turn-helix domain-containing protein [Nocardioides sp.]MBC7275514.1 helix-turn-helix domain-containing protein [Nocardioides sp.]